MLTKLHCDTVEKDLLKNHWSPNPLTLPSVITPKGLSTERQWYLFEKMRPFYAPGDQDLTCTEPIVPKTASEAGTPSALEDEEVSLPPPAAQQELMMVLFFLTPRKLESAVPVKKERSQQQNLWWSAVEWSFSTLFSSCYYFDMPLDSPGCTNFLIFCFYCSMQFTTACQLSNPYNNHLL